MIKLKSFVLCAGPTTGKTTWAQQLVSDGYTVLDSDTYVDLFAKPFFDERLWENVGTGPDDKDWLKCVHGLLGACTAQGYSLAFQAAGSSVSLAETRTTLILTNQWSEEFRKAMTNVLFPEKTSWKLPVYVYRKDPVEIVELFNQRDQDLELRTAKHWVKSAEKYAPSCFDKVIALERGQFLSDIFEMGFGPRVGRSKNVK